MKDIAVVLLNWNGKKHLETFLPSVVKYTSEARIIIADNGSTDDSIDFIELNFPTIELIKNDRNYGFAGGYNEALKFVKSTYYLLLNTDVEVTEGWLLPLFAEIQKKEVAAVQPKVKSYINKHKFEHAGSAGGFLDRNGYPFCRGRIFHKAETDTHQYDYKEEVFWTSGACMLIKSNVFWEAGAFDDSFFAHMEEIDLCWRIKRLGYSLICEPKSEVFHLGGGTLSYESPRKTFLNFRNSLLMITKNSSGILLWKLFVRMILDGIAGIKFIFAGDFIHTWAIVKAHFSFYGKLGSMLKQRKRLKKQMYNKQENKNGTYRGSILWAFYIKKINRFQNLNQRLFETKQ